MQDTMHIHRSTLFFLQASVFTVAIIYSQAWPQTCAMASSAFARKPGGFLVASTCLTRDLNLNDLSIFPD